MTSDVDTIDYDDLDHDLATERMTLDGQPFTGVAVERFGSGQLMSRTEFRDGRRHGTMREWSDDGTLTLEAPYVFDLYHGDVREWSDDGHLVNDSLYELGIRLRTVEYGQDGNVTGRFELQRTDKMYSMLQKLRDGGLGTAVRELGLPLDLDTTA